MAFSEPITKLDTFKEYLHEVGEQPSGKFQRAFACGLPAAWMYLKSIGLEELYFDLMKRTKNRYMTFKELFYLMLLANGKSSFFPTIASGFLKFKIPPMVAAAQVEVEEPAFRMAYGFTREQLHEVLSAIAKPNYMIRIGNQRKAVAIMYADNAYHVYHIDNEHALEFKTVDGCVDLVMRVMSDE